MEPRQRRFQLAKSIQVELARPGWTQQHLSEVAQMPLSVLEHKLAGDMPIDLDELEAIAEALGVAVDSLLGER